MSDLVVAGRWRIAAWLSGGFWLAAWLWAGRQAMLDDALIHLRFAHNWAANGVFAYNVCEPSYGTSSPFFVVVLAVLSRIWSGPLLPKVVSVVFYLLLVLALSRPAWTHSGLLFARACVVALLLGPIATRWLADGMETSMTAVLVLGIVRVCVGRDRKPNLALEQALIAVLIGIVAVLTRVELAAVIIFAVAASWLLPAPSKAKAALLPLAVGGGIGCLVLIQAFGSLLPDTAIAKVQPSTGVLSGVVQVCRTLVASGSFGVGLTVAWIALLVTAWRLTGRSDRGSLLVANALVPAMVVVIAVRGQVLHGVRHLLWSLLFVVAWNLTVVKHTEKAAAPTAAGPGSLRFPWRRHARGAVFVAIALAWAVEAPTVLRVLASRSAFLGEMRQARLDRLANGVGAAFDIGFVGFFSSARMLDLSGLVGGRRVAEMTSQERAAWAASQHPGFLFVTREQAASLRDTVDMSRYFVAGRFTTRTLRTAQTYLLGLDEASNVLFHPPGSPDLPTLASQVEQQ